MKKLPIPLFIQIPLLFLGYLVAPFPEMANPSDVCIDGTWTATSTANAPTGRDNHTAVWTGSEMIVWGGHVNVSPLQFDTGGKYNPSTDTWTVTSTTNAPARRENHTAVWTGSEMIVWGGFGSASGFVNTGGRYNPSTDSWTAISTLNAPTARNHHTAIWTGSEMIVWGGDTGFSYFNTGARYNPNTNTWRTTSMINAPTRRGVHTAVWTGSEMIVWGGYWGFGDLNDGGRYNPSTDTWTAISTLNAPTARNHHTAIWTGNQMIVWSGYETLSYLNNGERYWTQTAPATVPTLTPTPTPIPFPPDPGTGGRYNPSTDTWTATTTTEAPSARSSHRALWTGSEMIVWGGSSPGGRYTNTGGRYNPSTDSWTATRIREAPAGRSSHTTAWTGSEMIVWGGQDGTYSNTGGRYCAGPLAPLVQSVVSRKTHGGAGSYDVNLSLTGTPGVECRSGGDTNDYTVVITFLANVSVTSNPQATVTSGIATIGNGGASNGGMITTTGNVVTIPLTNVADAQTINVTLNAVNGATNVVIPMSRLLGDTNGDGFVNAGDALQTRSRSGQATNPTNFRSDVNTDGVLNGGDTFVVRAWSGTSLP